MAEESGLVVAIGEWVLEEACRQAVTWSCTFGSTPRMAVNGSGRQLGEPSFVGHVADVLASTGMTLRSLYSRSPRAFCSATRLITRR